MGPVASEEPKRTIENPSAANNAEVAPSSRTPNEVTAPDATITSFRPSASPAKPPTLKPTIDPRVPSANTEAISILVIPVWCKKSGNSGNHTEIPDVRKMPVNAIVRAFPGGNTLSASRSIFDVAATFCSRRYTFRDAELR